MGLWVLVENRAEASNYRDTGQNRLQWLRTEDQEGLAWN